MPEPLLTYRGTVYPWHCDHVGHMNVMWYVGKFDEATWSLFSALGLSAAFLRDNIRGVAAVEQAIAYKKELMAGDVVTIYSDILDIRDRAIRLAHEIRKTDSGETAATTILTAVHLDTKSRRACPFPAAVKDKARAILASVNG
jgi:acyl-CoA thioester hydrolase